MLGQLDYQSQFDTPFGRQVRKHGKLLAFEAGQPVFRRDETLQGLYLISSGILGIFKDNGKGREKLLWPVFHGLCVNTFPTGRNVAVTSLTALTKSHAFFLHHTAFTQMIEDDHAFLGMVGDIVNHNFQMTSVLLNAGRLESAQARIAEFIRLQDAIQPQLGPDAGTLIEDRISQALIAEMLGVSRPYFNQQVRKLRGQKSRPADD